MKKYLVGLLLLVAVTVYAADPLGWYMRTDCGTLTTPPNGSVCMQLTSVSGRTAGHVYARRSSAWVDVDTSGSGAPTDATYITQTANGDLSAEQALSALATGLMKVTTTTGAITSVTTSAGVSALISDETGTGVMVFATTPTLVTPVLGVATATSINKVAITAPASSATLTIADGKVATVSNTVTFTATDGSTAALGAGGTVTYSGHNHDTVAGGAALTMKGMSAGNARVSTQFDKTNDDTIADVTGLTVALLTTRSYGFRAVIFADNHVTGGGQYAIKYSGTLGAIIYNINCLSNASGLFIVTSRKTASAGAAGQAGATGVYCDISGLLTTTGAGNLTVQFAQQTATPATVSSVLVGSHMQVWDNN
jgi:hypothetical protein